MQAYNQELNKLNASQAASFINQGKAANALSPKLSPTPTPGTVPAIILRLEGLSKKASSVSHHCADMRTRVCGSYPVANESGAVSGPTAVPNGFLEEVDCFLNDIASALHSADVELEQIWSKIG